MTIAKYAPALRNLPLVHQGKTRDTFAVQNPDGRFDCLLVVATDRISTHNIVHLSTIPLKGQVLTALTVYWLHFVLGGGGINPLRIRSHLVDFGDRVYRYLPGTRSEYPDDLRYRAIVVRKLTMLPVEFVIRNFLVGSLHREYYARKLPNPYGVELPPGLPVMTEFPQPIFTPTNKSANDEPRNSREIREKAPQATALAMDVFGIIDEHLLKRGLKLIDSKFEIGIDDSCEPVIADELGTPDSSRICDVGDVILGKEPPWLDKQLARDEAERVWGKGGKCALQFSPEVERRISRTYEVVFERITQQRLSLFQNAWM